MAIATVEEFDHLERDAKGRTVMVGRLPPLARSQVDFSAGAANSSVFDLKTKYVRVWSDVDAYIEVGDAPTADSTTTPITAKVAEYFGVVGGHRMSVIAQ